MCVYMCVYMCVCVVYIYVYVRVRVRCMCVCVYIYIRTGWPIINLEDIFCFKETFHSKSKIDLDL